MALTGILFVLPSMPRGSEEEESDSVFVSGKALTREGKLVDVDAERVLRLAAESRDYLCDQAGLSSTEAK